MKKLIASAALVALVGMANATNVTNLFPNGDFESGGAGAWVENGGGDTFSYPTTDGNPGGFGIIDDTSATWGIWVGGDATPLALASLGLTAGQTYTFVQDMKIISGSSIGGVKIESWGPSGYLDNGTGDMRPVSGTTNWATYSFTYTINPAATGLKIVPLWGPGSVVGYDNLGVVVQAPEPLSVSITAPVNSQVVYSNFSISAKAAVFPGSVTNVAFFLDGTLKNNDPSSPFRYTVTGVSSGSHTLRAVALDSNGNAATSSVVNITVTNLVIPPGTITFDAASSGSTGNAAASSCTWSHTVGSGVARMLVVGISTETSPTVPSIVSVIYGGIALTHVPGGRAASGGAVDSADIYYLMSPTVGTANIVVTFNTTLAGYPNSGGAACGAVSLFGVTQDAPEAVAINNTGTTATTTISTPITTLTAGAWLVDVVNHGNGSSSFSGWPGTKQWDLRAATAVTICSGGGATVPVPTAGLVTDTWTYGASSRMAQSVSAFAPATSVLLSMTVAITSPTNSQVVSTTSFTINASATVSPGTITNVDFYMDAVKIGNVTNAPFNRTVLGVAAGAHALKVVAKDNGGNSVTSAVVNVTAANFAPIVSLASPANGNAFLVGVSVPLVATATDDGTVTNVNFYVDGTLVGTDNSGPYNATWASATLGVHALTVVARDNGGLSTTSAVVNITGLASFAAYESFNYGGLPNGTASTASGFNGNWTCVPAPSLVSGLTYSGLTTSDNALSSTGGRQFVSFAAPLSSGTEWISFLFNQTGDPGAVNNGLYFPNGGTGLFFGFGLAPFSATQGSLRLGSMNTTGAGYQGAAMLSTSANLQDFGTTYLVVLKIDFNTSGNNDTVTTYINPPTGTNSPGVADQVVSSFDVGTITGIGVNVGNTTFTVDEIRRANNYAEVVGGTIINPTQPALSISPVAGNQFTLSWPTGNLGWFLQTQTNSLKAGLSTNWVDVPGTETSAQSVITIDPTNPTLFFRLRSP